MNIAESIYQLMTDRGYSAIAINYGYLVLPMNSGRLTFPVPVTSVEKYVKRTGKLSRAKYTYSDGSVLTYGSTNVLSKWRAK